MKALHFFIFFIYLPFLSNSCNPLSPTVFIAFLHSFKLKSMFSQSCAVPCYRLNEAINVRRNRNWSWFLSFLVNGQKKRARKKTENRKPANLKAASTERIPADSCLWWEKKQPLGTSCATAYSQVTHPIESRSNIIPCFCTQSSVTSVACSLYCCVFVNSCRFFWGGDPGMWAELNAKGVKVVDLPSVQFLDLFGPPNEVQKQTYTRCKISF